MATDAEERAHLLRIRCKTIGHTFRVVTDGRGEPSGLVCRGCGRTWPVESERYPDEGQDQTGGKSGD